MTTTWASPRRALLYCTFNGVANCTNGIGRQTKTLLSVADRRWPELTAEVGSFDLHLACPQPSPATWAYNSNDLAEAERVAGQRGGAVHSLCYDISKAFWSVDTWRALCKMAAEVALDLGRHYDHVLTIGVDSPFAGLGHAVDERLRRTRPTGRVSVLLAYYSTAHIVERPNPYPARVTWERHGITSANTLLDVWVADVGRYLTRHLVETYGLDPRRLVPYRSCLDLTSPDLALMAPHEAASVAANWGVPLDRPIVLFFGRADPIKGVEALIDAAGPLRNRIHLAVIAVPYDDAPNPLPAYQQRIVSLRLQATVVGRFTRALPRALCSLPATRVVACPSLGEPLANVPFEVALWARDGGPIVVAAARDGFVEQIDHQATGLLYDPSCPDGLTTAITQALDLNEETMTRMRLAADTRVRAERDIAVHLPRTLAFFWAVR